MAPEIIEQLEKGRIDIRRYFTQEHKDPFQFDFNGLPLKWAKQDVNITDDNGKLIFTQPNVEHPNFWSDLAIRVVASKYFWGNQEKNERENSIRQLILRVADFFKRQALAQKYLTEHEAQIFRDELVYINLNQFASFNSPVWFNAGISKYDLNAGGVSQFAFDTIQNKIVKPSKQSDKPQCSACFIQKVEDNMDSIMALQVSEANLFKAGSGTGSNYSALRSSKERLTGGGWASGPVSFLRGYDSYAGIIKSGGKTRRAAKMVILNIDHPDIMKFITIKQNEEKKAWALIEHGYDGGLNGEAYNSVGFQNCNLSVRANDAFMHAVKENSEWQTRYVKTREVCETSKAKELIKKIAEGTYVCGDPGIQFDDTINKWHTCKNSGRINASNPCSEFMFVDDSACNLASINLLKFKKENGTYDIEQFKEVVRTIIIAMELAVDGGSYPTEEITKNSHNFRPLGLGYANLGALLMSLGLPYDSDAGRALCSVLTAILTGQAYKTSAELAALAGPFPKFNENKNSMLEVMKMHRSAIDKIDFLKLPSGLQYLFDVAKQTWDEAIILGEKFGYRNSQTTVLAPTGCLIQNSLVSTDKGLVRLSNLGNKNGEKWQDVSFKVMTDQGPRDATKFYINGKAKTRKIRTSSGYEIQGTEKHRIKVLDIKTNQLNWKRFDEITEGDIVPLAINTLFGEDKEVLLPLKPELHWLSSFELRTPEKMNEKLAELVGYFMGDGSLHSKGLRFCVDNKDSDVVEKISNLITDLFNLKVFVTQQKGYKEVTVNSIPLTMWWKAAGFSKIKPSAEHTGKGYIPYIPDAILHTNSRKIYSSFLRGLYEADGTLISGVPSISTFSEEFAYEIKSLLLALGYPTTTKIDKSGWGKGNLFVLRLKNISYNKEFLDKVGFISQRKINSISLGRSLQSGKNDKIYISKDLFEEAIPVGNAHRNAALLSMKRNHSISREMAVEIYQDTKHPQLLWALQFFYDRIESNLDGGIQQTYDLSVPDNVTYIANGFVGHNTIAFMMDCDTTGIEPDIALVKYKTLAGGGMLKIINKSVPSALKSVGYTIEETAKILDYLNEKETIEGAPGLKDTHLPVFDCAFKAAKGKRSIHYTGHLKMMAAAQPFLSGAISKTINLPEGATIEEIEEAYTYGWELGLKALAIYRENSKRSQPLNTEKTKGEMVKKFQKSQVSLGDRIKLPQTRSSITHKFEIAGHEGYITIGLYDTGKPGEIFITMHKEGSTIRGLMDAWATSVSLNLQYGASVSDLFGKFIHQKFEPAGFVKNPGGGNLDKKIKTTNIASSIVDYVAQFMINNFGEGKEQFEIGIKPNADIKDGQAKIEDFGNEGITCPHCGGPAKRIGNCEIICVSCKQTTRRGCGE